MTIIVVELFIILVFSLSVIFWIYFGYPVVLKYLADKYEKPVTKDEHYEPFVTVMIMTYNEASTIRRKIENTLALEYPKQKLHILVVDSMSDDDTVKICRNFPEIDVVQECERRGKSMAVKFGMSHAKGEIIVVTDANCFYESQSLRKLVGNFADPEVGGVTGAFHQRDQSGTPVAGSGEYYWERERKIRQDESRLFSVIALSGEMSAFRKELGLGVEFYSGADDFDMTIHLIKQHRRVIFEPYAMAWEIAADNVSDFMNQRIKVIVMAITVARKELFKVLFNPRFGWYGNFILPSRRVLPLFSPFLLITSFFSTLFLTLLYPFFPFLALLLCQLSGPFIAMFYQKIPLPGISRIYYFYLMNWLVLKSWSVYLKGHRFVMWNKVNSTRN
ncbi:glycosyltransferase [bacterium]|nr:glycosyltransferase [candidate division CSSED10-310 bacterium]